MRINCRVGISQHRDVVILGRIPAEWRGVCGPAIRDRGAHQGRGTPPLRMLDYGFGSIS